MTDRQAKLYYTISEVATQTGVKPHVLRYWESEFPSLRPRKTRSGSRRYRQRDIEEIQAIKQLLYEQGYRIAGARKLRRQSQGTAQTEGPEIPQMQMPFAQLELGAQVAFLRAELGSILDLVRDLGGSGRAGAAAEVHGQEAEGEA